MYVSCHHDDCIEVYEISGQFVTSFGSCDQNEGEFRIPYYINYCADAFNHVAIEFRSVR